MKIHYNYHQNIRLAKGFLLSGIASLGLGFLSISAAQADDDFVRITRTIENDELNALGISNPVGLLFSPKAEELLILEESEAATEEIEVTTISLDEEESSSPVTIPTDILEPINAVFDSNANRILVIHPETKSDAAGIIEVKSKNNGELPKDPTITETEIPDTLPLENPQGVTTDPEEGFIYILDSGKIVRVEPRNEGGLDGATAIKVPLPSGIGAPDQLRGIAFNPNDELIYVYNSVQQKLYGIDKNGALQSTRDLSDFGLSSTQSIVFAPSGDTTDDPSQLSLYIVDKGLTDEGTTNQIAQAGRVGAAGSTSTNTAAQAAVTSATKDTTPNSQIIEISLIEPPSARAAATSGTLVQIIDLSQLNNPHFPATSSLPFLATPDPSGITYLPGNDSVLIVDGEVEEVTGAPSTDYNVFEIDYGFNVPDIDRLTDVLTIVETPFVAAIRGAKFSNEPTGISAVNPNNGHVFVSDDDVFLTNDQSIFEVAPGPDGVFATPDDLVTKIILTTLKTGGIKDPEGVAYGEVALGQKRIFIAGGSDNEVYIVDLGANGILNVGDTVTNFDTLADGLRDPEGIEFDPNTGTLYVIGEPIDKVFEYQVDGTLVQSIDISAALPGAPNVPTGLGLNQPAGLILAPSSVGGPPNLYIVDRGIDNRGHPTENDGQLFEINIGTVNQNPIAVDDNVTTVQDTAVVDGNVLDGTLSGGTADSDPDGNSIQVDSNTAPGNGTLTSGVTANGLFTYTPDAGFTGSDSFNYTISDGQGGTATATVNIQVTPSPGGGNQIVSSKVATSSDDAEEKDASGFVTTTNSDLDLTASLGDTQTTGVRFHPAIPSGATIVNAYIQFTADEVNATATSLTFKGQNSSNAPTFTTANRNISGRATTINSVTWNVPAWNNVGDAGSAQRTPDLSTIIQEIVNISGWSNGNGLAIIITGTGKRPAETYDADPAKAAVLHVEYSTGPSGGNQNPNAVNDSVTTQQDTSVNGNVLNGSLSGGTADSDPDGNSIQVDSNTTPSNGTLTSGVTANGLFTYTPDLGFTGSDSFNYTLSDGQGGVATATVSITVTAGNQNPTAVNDSVETQQDTEVNGNVLDGTLSGGTADSDPDGGTIQVSSNTSPSNGSLTSGVTSDGLFTYSPDAGFTGTDAFDYTLSDGQGGTATATVSIQVTLTDSGNQTVTSQVATSSDDAEEKDISGFVTTTNGDLDFTESGGNTQTTGIRFLLDVPSGVTIVNAYIQFTADEVNSTATSLTIRGQNSGNAPTFSSANGNISGRATTSNSVSWSSVPSWNNVGDAGSAQRTPDLSSIIQEVINGSGWSNGNGLAIIIEGTGKRPAETYDAAPAKAAVLHVEYNTGSSGGNQNPNAVNDSVTTQQDTSVNGNVLNGSLSGGTADNDPDGDTIQVSGNTTPNNGSLSSGVTANGIFTYTPDAGFTGSDSFIYTISDGQGGTATASVSLQVTSTGGGNQIVTSQVAVSSDDAEEKDASGFVTTTNGDLDLTESGGDTQTMGVRFLLNVPAGATIVNAYIQFTADEVRSAATSLIIQGQSSSNAPTFTSNNGDISGRATTSNSVAWSSVLSWNNVGDAGLAQQTPDLSSIIQEIVDGSGWSNGNGLAIILTGNGKRPAETYDADPTNAAVLHVEFNSE